uniref:Uncharacterized protein n=1 Tax=Panagrolaimus sp. JU765 TaxID=591449 RepID=A0AC34Q249_9BILA
MEDIELIDITLDNDQEDDQQVNSVQTPLVNDDKKQDEDEEEEDEDEKLITIALSRLSKNGGDSFITTENEKIPDAASEKTQSADDFYQPSSAEMLLSEWDEFGAIKDFGF